MSDLVSPLTVDVTGSSLANIVTSPLALTPAFDPTITDYVLRCQSGVNTVHATLSAAGGTINALGNHGASIYVQEDLIENEAMVIAARAPRSFAGNQRISGDVDENGRVQYWIRCLPQDFPQLSVLRPGNPPPGWYLTSNVAPAGGSPYSIVLDNNGTPVYYRMPARGAAWNVTPLPDGTIAWWGSNVIENYNLRTQATRLISSPDLPIDFHELHALPNGDVMILSYPPKPNVDLSPLGLSSSSTITDCVIEELDAKAAVVWRWRASDHISPAESSRSSADIFHCNSVDTDPRSGNVLLSSRHTDAVYLIDKSTGTIIWKMGGNSPNHDHAQILTIKGDPEGVFHAQHDARFQPNGDVSLYDDQTWNASLAARGVEYHIDTHAGTATLVWAYQSPDGHNALATGSFRRLNGGTDNVVGWGIKPNSPLFTEVDGQGRVLLAVTFPNGQLSYRVVKVPVTSLDHGLLRAAAGLPAFVPTTSPMVAFVGAHAPVVGGGTVNITGAGFTGATRVAFGLNDATNFTVNNDSSITAMAPNGSGSVSVSVTTAGGTSAEMAGSILTKTDADFEGAIGSWRSAVSLAPSTEHAQSGNYSLQLSLSGKGTESVVSGRYAVPPGALVIGGEWVLTPQRQDRVSTFIAFYDSNGALIAIRRGPLVTTATNSWTRVAETTVSPARSASAALGFEDMHGVGAVYVDSASLSGSDRYAYHSPDDESG